MRFTSKTLVSAVTLLAASALIAGSGPAALGAPAATVSPGPWTQTDYNAAMSEANPGESTLTPATLSKVGYLRSVAAAPDPVMFGCDPEQGYVAPSLAGGDLYAVADNRVLAYQASNGQTLWQHVLDPTGSSTFFSLALSGNLVIVGSEFCGSASDPNGTIQAYSAATGAPAWSAPVNSTAGPMNAMVVADGLVIGSGASAGSGTVVSAHQASDGKLVWQQGYGCGGGTGPAVVVGGVVVFAACTVANNTPFLQGDSLATGARLWRRSGTWQVQRGDLAASAGKNVFASSGGSVFDLNPLTGATRYTLTGAGSVLAVGSSQVYANCSTVNLCGYQLSDGHQLWQHSNGAQQLVVEAGGVLYLGDGEALNATSGAHLSYVWEEPNPNLPAEALAVGEGRIAVVDDPRVLDLYGLSGF
jgi:PQQ-like domain